MVVEILSVSSAKHDLLVKYNKYRDVGVREYWIINPESRTVMVYILNDGQYVGHAYGETDVISVAVLDDCQITLSDVFPPVPPVEEPDEAKQST